MKFNRFFVIGLGILTSLGILCSTTENTNNFSNASTYETDKANQAEVLMSNVDDGAYGVETEDLIFRFAQYNETFSTKSITVTVNQNSDGDTAQNYYVGYYGEGDEYLPAQLVFDAKYPNGTIKRLKQNIIRKNYNGIYDGIGPNVGSTSLSTFCDIELPYDVDIDLDSICLVNVFKLIIEKDDSGITISKEVDLKNPQYVVGIRGSKSNTKIFRNFTLDQFIDMKFLGYADYSGYTSLTFNVDTFSKTIYPFISSTSSNLYEEYKEKIDDGSYFLRTRLSFSSDSIFDIKLKNGEELKIKAISSPININAENGNKVSFIFNQFKGSDVENFKIYNIYINNSICSSGSAKNISKSLMSTRFGVIDLGFEDIKDSTGNIVVAKVSSYYTRNINLIFIVSMIIYTVVFWTISLIVYFVSKEKNKNDEFKKMKTTEFFKTDFIAFLCIGFVILSIETIFYRIAYLTNSFAVYNPLDVYIIAFSIAGLLLIGYFVRYFFIMIKNNIEKKRIEKLKINQDKLDDGTTIR